MPWERSEKRSNRCCMILYGSVARGAGSRLWKKAFFALQLVPSSIPGADGFSLTTYGGYLSSKQCQKAKLVSVTFLLCCQRQFLEWGTPLTAGGAPSLLYGFSRETCLQLGSGLENQLHQTTQLYQHSKLRSMWKQSCKTCLLNVPGEIPTLCH